MTQTILVLGATGTIGKNVIDWLPDNEDMVIRAAVRSISEELWSHRSNVQQVEFDFTRPETFAPALAGVDRVFLMTPISSMQVDYAKAVIDAAKAASVSHIAYMSALGADQIVGMPVLDAYRAVEVYLEQSGVPYTHLRAAPLMDNFMSGFRPNQEDKLVLPAGNVGVYWISATDFALVAVHVLIRNDFFGRALDVTGEEALSIEQIVAALGAAVGRTIQYVPSTRDEALQAMCARGISAVTANSLLDILGKDGMPPQSAFTVHAFNAAAPQIPIVPYVAMCETTAFSHVAVQFANDQIPDPLAM